jgi:DNA-binding response OmpR family regulator
VSSQAKILIVEDDEPIRQMYDMKLARAGLDTFTAKDGAEGLKKAEAIKPDLILLDLRMPNISGEDMLEEIRSRDWGADIHVVILTNISKSEAPAKLRFLNVERYIVKVHTTPTEVINIVKEVLGSPKS